jgi:hypothetical protein
MKTQLFRCATACAATIVVMHAPAALGQTAQTPAVAPPPPAQQQPAPQPPPPATYPASGGAPGPGPSPSPGGAPVQPPPAGATYPKAYAGSRVFELDQRIDQLRDERAQYGLGGPITMLAIGGGVLLVSGSLALMLATLQSRCDPTYDSCGSGSSPVVFGLIAAGGAGLGVAGGVMLGNRIGKRRELGTEIKRLERERDGIQQYGVTYGFNLRRGGAVGHLELTF